MSKFGFYYSEKHNNQKQLVKEKGLCCLRDYNLSLKEAKAGT